MNYKTLQEVKELAEQLFKQAAALVGYFAREESEILRNTEELKKTGKIIC